MVARSGAWWRVVVRGGGDGAIAVGVGVDGGRLDLDAGTTRTWRPCRLDGRPGLGWPVLVTQVIRGLGDGGYPRDAPTLRTIAVDRARNNAEVGPARLIALPAGERRRRGGLLSSSRGRGHCGIVGSWRKCSVRVGGGSGGHRHCKRGSGRDISHIYVRIGAGCNKELRRRCRRGGGRRGGG